MKMLPLQPCLAALLFAGLSVFLASRPAIAAAEPPGVVVQDNADQFMEKFRKAMQVGATDEMNRLVRTQQENAVNKIVQICEFISSSSNEKLEGEIAALTKAWKAVYKTEFPDKIYEFFSLMRPEIKQHRTTLKAQYELQNKNFREAETTKDQTKFGELGMLMKGLGESFEQIADYYYASQAYLYWGKANDEFLRGPNADLKAAHDGFLKCIQTREKVDLKDIYYSQAKERQQHLEAAGFGDPAKGPVAPTEPVEGAALTLAPTFEMIEDIEAYRRPIYTADPVYMMWPNIQMREKGTSTKFLSIKDSPTVMRIASSKVMVDVNGDGEGDVEVPMTGKLVPVHIKLGSGETEREWGFLAAVGADRDTFNGIQFNASPSDTFMSIYIAPAASLVADVNGTRIRILDDNMDGIYGSGPLTWGYAGLIEDFFQKDVDSVIVGESTVAAPWSEFLEIGGQWYRMESAESGVDIKATPVLDVVTGRLKLDLKGIGADWVVVKGVEKSRYENSYFEIAGAKAGVEVPAGAYQLFVGQVSKGKKTQMMKALMLPTRNTPTWTVEEGKTTAVKLGAPFGFDFHVSQDATTATVVGESISVIGSANESYQRLWNCVARPEASMREAGTKRGSKGEDMKGAATQEELGDKGFKYAWFPFDLILDKKSNKDVEVQLVEKKNKLFGKIESIWR